MLKHDVSANAPAAKSSIVAVFFWNVAGFMVFVLCSFVFVYSSLLLKYLTGYHVDI